MLGECGDWLTVVVWRWCVVLLVYGEAARYSGEYRGGESCETGARGPCGRVVKKRLCFKGWRVSGCCGLMCSSQIMPRLEQ